MSVPLDPAGPFLTRLCGCGCGRPTRISKKTRSARGDRKGQPVRFLKGHGRYKYGRPRKAHMDGSKGYVLAYAPSHPRASKGYVYEHLLIVERALGKPLRKTAQVHHVDRNKANNAPRNLVACHDSAYHRLLHQRLRALEACGNPSARSCRRCLGFDRQEEIVVPPRYRNGRQNAPFHRDCESAYDRQRRRAA